MTEPMTDERMTERLEMAAEVEHALRLKAEVRRLRKELKELEERADILTKLYFACSEKLPPAVRLAIAAEIGNCDLSP